MMRIVKVSTVIKRYIKDINCHLNQLKRKKVWKTEDYRKIECFPAIVYTLKDWCVQSNSNDEIMHQALDKLLEKISQIHSHRKVDIYPFGEIELFIIRQYKKKFKENPLETMNNFEKGNDRALFQALKHDGIHWLYNSYAAKLRLLMAEAMEDKLFFDRLAKALKNGTKQKTGKIKKDSEYLYDICFKCWINGYINFDNISETKKFLDGLREFFNAERDKLDDIDESKQTKKNKADIKRIDSIFKNVLYDENYFIHKWLPRHGIRRKKTRKS